MSHLYEERSSEEAPVQATSIEVPSEVNRLAHATDRSSGVAGYSTQAVGTNALSR